MNQKTAKLFRYFVKHSGDAKLAAVLQGAWPFATHKQKGKVTTWMKKVVVSMMAVKDMRKKHEEMIKHQQVARNMDILKGFST